jgi:hypothetical protein
LYIINFKENCKPPVQSDTAVTQLTKAQSNYLFDLSNNFVNNFKLVNRVDPNKQIEGCMDGGNIKVEICLMNMCKSVDYYSYCELDKISPDLNKLMNYISLLTKKSKIKIGE